MDSKTEFATFAGGCFWCMEKPFEDLPGVISVISGYTGGHKQNPAYQEVCSGTTGHLEAIQITFRPSEISYEKLLDVFWEQIDPTDPSGQFVDKGSQYTTAVFFHKPAQRRAAEKSRSELQHSGIYQRPIVTDIRKAETFYPAEEYHQDYHRTNPQQYKNYRNLSGRDQFIRNICRIKEARKVPVSKTGAEQPPPEDVLRKKLTPLQYNVTRENMTERPFDNKYWDQKAPGIYVDVISGKPLFSSLDKFESGTGWPSFTRPLEKGHIEEKSDLSHGMARTEARSRSTDSHLGHVFNDGPEPTGLRYCINSAALRFIPAEKLEEEGYGKYRSLFSGQVQ